MSKVKSILKQGSVYFLGTQAAQAITLVAAILSRRFLGPTQTGIWATLQILVDYSKYSTAGLLDATSREIPYQIGKGNPAKANDIKDLAFSFISATSLAVAVGLMLFAWVTRGRFRPEVTTGILMVALVIFLQRFNNLMIGLLRAFKQFHIESHMIVASALVNAILVGFLTYHFKIYGFIWAMILSLLFNILYLFVAFRFDFHWRYNAAELKPLLKYGFPLLLLGLLTTAFRSIDKIMVVRLLGFKELGIYSIALMACSYMSNFSIAAGVILIPHFQEKYGTRDQAGDLRMMLIKSSWGFAIGMSTLIYAAWLFAPYLIQLFLPKFIVGIPAMRILMLNMFFIALMQPYHDSLVTIKKYFQLFPIYFFASLLTAALDYGAVRLGKGINGVAFATTLSFFITFTLLFFRATANFMNPREALRKYLSLGIVFLYLLLGTAAAARMIPAGNTFSLRTLASQGLAFILFEIPLIYLLNKNFGILEMLSKKMRVRKSKKMA